MADGPKVPTLDRRGPGCLQAAASGVALALLSPIAAAVREWRRHRRGDELRLGWSAEAFAGASKAPLLRIDVRADVPERAVAGCHANITDAVVRIAETLRRSDDVYHMVVRERASSETTLLPVGPLLQELGERFSLNLAQAQLAGRTVLWLTLARTVAPADVLDPFAYDPEADGEPERLIADAAPRWAVATSFLHSGPSYLLRMLLYVPEDSRAAIEALLDRLRNSLA